MPINHNEIIEDIEDQIRRCGGAWEEWCVGTAKDSRGPFFQRHREADLGDGLTYREAYTPDAAQAVVAHLVNNRGLEPHRDAANEAEPRALQEPGKIVFVYRKTPATAVRSEHPTFHKLAASWLTVKAAVLPGRCANPLRPATAAFPGSSAAVKCRNSSPRVKSVESIAGRHLSPAGSNFFPRSARRIHPSAH